MRQEWGTAGADNSHPQGHGHKLPGILPRLCTPAPRRAALRPRSSLRLPHRPQTQAGPTADDPFGGCGPPEMATHQVACSCVGVAGGDRAGWRGHAEPAGKRLPCTQHRSDRAGGGGKARGRRGLREESPPHFLPGPAPARGAALGRGQRFFVSPALSARHCGGPRPSSVDCRFMRHINFPDYSLERKRLNKL